MKRVPLKSRTESKGTGNRFEKGHHRVGGRPKGSRNKMTRLLREAILIAAERVGADGRGKEGVIGYLMKLARVEPKAFAMLLGKVLPLQITGENGKAIRIVNETMTPQEAVRIYTETLQTLNDDMRSGETIHDEPRTLN